MNKLGIILLLLLAASCVDKSTSEVQKVHIQAPKSQSSQQESELDTINLDLERSKLFWKGTKMRRTGSHEGEVGINQGFLLRNKTDLIGGKFEIDMKRITITDIPISDPIPIKNLTEHLMDSDFFDVDNFPISTFEITKIKTHSPENLEISGNLSIRGISKNITFMAIHNGNSINARFLIDRFDWNIAYEGYWTDRTLVDREIEFQVELMMESKK
ncbi:YceI family protein [Algoriphagus lacus]|uniref:YceI family protein n=1 Tax=Algoriphagus lacus TaxID=2056311 RepID=A0A418PWE0_9BACT|nr:YceI family protein [Algoriphagus lacus]RIW18389.1 YceI family protein [Algoriphagus lacus]